MTSAVETLELAWFVTGRSEFAERAVEQIHTWFVKWDRRMNPHTEYLQHVPGRDQGWRQGIIETVGLATRIIDSRVLLRPCELWPEDDRAAVKQWFRDYLT